MTINHHGNAAEMPARDPDELDLSALLDIAIDNRYLIAIVIAICIVASLLYSLLHAPIYRADIVVQVEGGSSGTTASTLASFAPLLDMKSTADAEIQLLGSRLVVSRAVDHLHLYIDARPRYFPLIGHWLAARQDTLSVPGLFGFGGFAWGAETIEIERFDVPKPLEDETFKIDTLSAGRFTLEGASLAAPVTGQVGQLLTVRTPEGPLVLRIERLAGHPGARFELRRASRLQTIEMLQRKLDVRELGKESDVLAVTYEGVDPLLVSRVLNEIGEQYVRQNVQRKTEEAQRSIDFLNGQLPIVAQALHDAEDRYRKTRQKAHSVNLSEEASLALQQSVDTETQLTVLQQKRLALSAQFAPGYPGMRALDEQIAELRAKLRDYNTRLAARPMIEQMVLRAARDVQLNQDLYETLCANLQQLQLVKAGKVGSVRLVDPAPVPELPIWPRPLILVPLAALAGLFMGFAIAMLRTKLFRGVTDSREIERRLDLPVYATVPNSTAQRQLEKRRGANRDEVLLLAVRQPDDPSIESLRSFRTAMLFRLAEAPNNRVMFTSALASVGKSFVSANMAALLASSGRRVLLVDTDVRRGHLHGWVGRAREAGFADLLGGADLDAVIQGTEVPSLDFVSAGAIGRDIDGLLQRAELGVILDRMSARYDVVVIDAAPILPVADATMLAPFIGTIFLIALAGSTKLPELEEATKRLRRVGTQPEGAVFNRVNATLGRYGYGAAYGGYRYAGERYGHESEADQ